MKRFLTILVTASILCASGMAASDNVEAGRWRRGFRNYNRGWNYGYRNYNYNRGYNSWYRYPSYRNGYSTYGYGYPRYNYNYHYGPYGGFYYNYRYGY